MRRLRWKRDYLTGIAAVDAANQSLVRLLTELDNELRAKEHCQDMEDLYALLLDNAQQHLAHKGFRANAQGLRNAIESLMRTQLPLPARTTAACRDCGICDLAQESLALWLRHSHKPSAHPRRPDIAQHQSIGFDPPGCQA